MRLSIRVVSDLWLVWHLWDDANVCGSYLLMLRKVFVRSDAELGEKVVEVDVCDLFELCEVCVPSRVLQLAGRGYPLQLI